jgi:ribosome maturation factor RimP
MSNLAEITELIDEKLRFMQLFLYDIKYIRAGKHGVLRVFIDKPGGVNIEDCERASNAISIMLDLEDFSDQAYSLEVSSPGLDRVLSAEKDFKMVIGHFLRVVVKKDNDATEEVVGKLVSCDKDSITLELEDERTRIVPLPEVVTGRVDIRFN